MNWAALNPMSSDTLARTSAERDSPPASASPRWRVTRAGTATGSPAPRRRARTWAGVRLISHGWPRTSNRKVTEVGTVGSAWSDRKSSMRRPLDSSPNRA